MRGEHHRPHALRAAVDSNELLDIDLLSRAETALDIGRPAAVVYAYLADFARHIEWAHTYIAVEPMSTGELGSGSRLLIREKQDLRWDKRPFATIVAREGAIYETELEITGLDPDRHISWRSLYRGAPLDSVSG